MKRHTSRWLAAGLALLLLLGLAACAKTPAPSSGSSDGGGLAAYAGEYSYFCVRMEGNYAADSLGIEIDPGLLESQYVRVEEMVGETVTLKGDGTGSLYWGEDNQGPISQWSLTGEQISISAGVSHITGTLKNGLMQLDINDGFTAYFALPGAEPSSIQPLSSEEYYDYVMKQVLSAGDDGSSSQEPAASSEAPQEENLLAAAAAALDPAQGVHLRYDLTLEGMGTTQSLDVHAKGGYYYSARSVEVAGYESTSATYADNGKVYSLSPGDQTGTFVMESSLAADHPLAMDTLYASITNHAGEAAFTRETREVEGVEYTAQVSPATDYTPQIAFCFDAAGRLAYVLEDPPVVDTGLDIGASVYEILVADGSVDEGLFDISTYQITK